MGKSPTCSGALRVQLVVFGRFKQASSRGDGRLAALRSVMPHLLPDPLGALRLCQLGARPAPSQLAPQFVIFWILRTMSSLCIRSASRDYAWQSVRHYAGSAVQQWSRFQQAPALRAQMVILDDCSSRCTVLAAVWFSPSLACRSYRSCQHRVDLLTRLVGCGKLRPIDSNADWIMLGSVSYCAG